MVSLPPAIWTPKPKRIAATIRGRMALRLNSSVKSGLVKKLMMSLVTSTASASAGSRASKPAGTTPTTRTITYMIIAAIAAVQRKVTTVVPMTFPALRAETMLATALEMEKKTSGTTTQNIMLMKIVPSGSRTVAPGQTQPVMAPATMPKTIVSVNQLFLKKLLDCMNEHSFQETTAIIFAMICQVNCKTCLKDCKKCCILR